MLKHQPSPITELVVQGIPGRKFIGLPSDPRIQFGVRFLISIVWVVYHLLELKIYSYLCLLLGKNQFQDTSSASLKNTS